MPFILDLVAIEDVEFIGFVSLIPRIQLELIIQFDQ